MVVTIRLADNANSQKSSYLSVSVLEKQYSKTLIEVHVVCIFLKYLVISKHTMSPKNFHPIQPSQNVRYVKYFCFLNELQNFKHNWYFEANLGRK